MPQPALDQLLPTLSHGDHCCLLFSSSEDQVKTTAPFLGYGLERDERCIYVGDEDSIEALRAGLRNEGINVDVEMQRNRLVLSSNHDYLEKGRFETGKMLGFLQQAYDAALADGFSALRAAGDISWEIGPDRDFKDVVYYETLLDVFFLGKRMVGMCQYHRERCPPDVLAGILNTHRIAAINQDVCRNLHYVPPEILLEKNPGNRQEKRVEWMTAQIMRAQKAEAEIARINAELEQRVIARTAELQAAYRDMEAFSYSISHDLRAPLRGIIGFAAALSEDAGAKLGAEEQRLLTRISHNAERMRQLIDDLLGFARVTRAAVEKTHIDMTALAQGVADELQLAYVSVSELPPAEGSAALLRQVFVNLLANAAKFTRKCEKPAIDVGADVATDGTPYYYVRDNGAGFDMTYAAKLFKVFQRLHRAEDFEGTGIGLAIVQKIIAKHGGRVWAEGAPDKGATFYFTLPASQAV